MSPVSGSGISSPDHRHENLSPTGNKLFAAARINSHLPANRTSSACLSNVLSLITEVQKKHKRRDLVESDAVEELRTAFESAETSHPGWTEAFIKELLQRVSPKLSSIQLQEAMKRLSK